jgi:F-type H+-transporting ATPase subunit a
VSSRPSGAAEKPDLATGAEFARKSAEKNLQISSVRPKSRAPAVSGRHFMRFLTRLLPVWLCSLPAAFASGAEHALPPNAEPIWGNVPITNSMLMSWVVVAIIVVFCRAATRKMSLVPSGIQNFCEWVVETLYDFLETILGSYLVKKTFWFFASIFVFILVSNLIGLFPGVGTIGRYDEHGRIIGFFRGPNADLNLTLAMATVFFALWLYWAVKENGFGGFLAHLFAPKGRFHGFMLLFMAAIFLIVGLLEIISICVRPVALTFRLFGNIYGGEHTMEKLMMLVPKQLAFLPALPFYFLELLVAFVQALVFMLLTAVFLRLICEHAGEEHGDTEHPH